MTANEWLGVMKQASDFPQGMEKLILKYGEMLIAEHEGKVKKLTIPDVSGSFPSENEIETAALNYRDKSDDESTNEDTMMVEVHWYDKQEAFTAGVKWFLENYR